MKGDGIPVPYSDDQLLPTVLEGREPPPGGGSSNFFAFQGRSNVKYAPPLALPVGNVISHQDSKNKSLTRVVGDKIKYSENKFTNSDMIYNVQFENNNSTASNKFPFSKILGTSSMNNSLLFHVQSHLSDAPDNLVQFLEDNGSNDTLIEVSGRVGGKHNRSVSYSSPPTAVAPPSVSQSEHWKATKAAFSIDSYTGTIYVLKVSLLILNSSLNRFLNRNLFNEKLRLHRK